MFAVPATLLRIGGTEVTLHLDHDPDPNSGTHVLQRFHGIAFVVTFPPKSNHCS